MCFDAADWKREEIPDHKFDYVNVKDFIDRSFKTKLLYSLVFILTMKAILVYAADLGAVALVISTYGLNNIFSGVLA
jgi:hypothetical protein